MKKYFFLLAGVILLLPLMAIHAAETSSQPPAEAQDGGGVVVADVNIYNAQLVSQENNHLKLSFDLANGKLIQPDVRDD